MTKAVIIIEGGIVQSVLTNDKDLTISVIDYDTDGIPNCQLSPIPQGEGRKDVLAYVYGRMEPEVNPEVTEELINIR